MVLGPKLPPGVPDYVVSDCDPVPLVELRATNKGDDVHLVGGSRTIETFRALGGLDKLELVILPLLFGGGDQSRPSLGTDTGLTPDHRRTPPGGSVEIVYSCGDDRRPRLGRPVSQR
jgi:dihydrofolate reductase